MNTGSDAHAAIQPFVCGVRGDARAMKFSLTLTFQIYYRKRHRVYGAAVGPYFETSLCFFTHYG